MRFAQVGPYAMLVLLASGCGDQAAPDAAGAEEPSPATLSLPCDEAEQGVMALAVPNPGRPTPEEAVAPYAGLLKLVAQADAGGTTVLGLRANETVFRVFEVTKHEDGWWPDGYRECWS